MGNEVPYPAKHIRGTYEEVIGRKADVVRDQRKPLGRLQVPGRRAPVVERAGSKP